MTLAATPQPQRPRLVPKELEVVTVRPVSPSLKRVTFSCPELIGADLGDSITIKLLFPRPEPEARPFGRPFTIRGFDGASGTLDVDFVLHDHPGVATQWARRAEPGMRLRMFGPRGAEPLPDGCHDLVFAGDITALPAMQVLVSRLPESARATVIASVPTLSDVTGFDSQATLRVEWLTEEHGSRRTLAAAVRDVAPQGVDFWWVACEMREALEVRRYLRHDLGLGHEQVHATPYWKAGTSEDAFHDERHDIMGDHD